MMTSVEIKRSFAKPGHQRVLKLRGDAQQIFVNGEFSGGSSGFWDYTMYVNPYMVVRPEGHYTKHIYVNSERIASKIGNPEDFGAGDPTGQGDAVGRKIKMEEVVEENFNELFGNVPEIEQAAEQELGMSSGSTEPEQNSYWFTSDHLGSSAFITDGSGVAIQHLEYMAFGEVFVDQRRTGFGTPYKFNAKELDCESGYYYYSARYYDPRMARFLSVDPAADLMPSWSPYSYTFNNPLKYIDPTGAIPYPITIRSFHPGKTFGGGFGGDSRGFSHRSSAISRISHTVIADAAAGTLSYNSENTSSSRSHHPIFGSDVADPKGYASPPSSEGNTLSFETGYAGKNPLVPSPEINVEAGLSITEDLDAGFLTISGSVDGDDFPNTEAFITDPSGQSVFIGGDVRGGNNPLELRGGADKRIMDVGFQIKIDSKGNFQNVIYKGQEYNIVDYNNMFIDKNPNPNNDRP